MHGIVLVVALAVVLAIVLAVVLGDLFIVVIASEAKQSRMLPRSHSVAGE
jgi:hypothetical protein